MRRGWRASAIICRALHALAAATGFGAGGGLSSETQHGSIGSACRSVVKYRLTRRECSPRFNSFLCRPQGLRWLGAQQSRVSHVAIRWSSPASFRKVCRHHLSDECSRQGSRPTQASRISGRVPAMPRPCAAASPYRARQPKPGPPESTSRPALLSLACHLSTTPAAPRASDARLCSKSEGGLHLRQTSVMVACRSLRLAQQDRELGLDEARSEFLRRRAHAQRPSHPHGS